MSVSFPVTLSGAAESDTVLGWTTAAGTATSGTDYTAVTAGTLTIAAEATTGMLTVATAEDMLAEGDETFTVTITGTTLPAGVTLGRVTATGTIEDDETLTAAVMADAETVVEGNTASFTVALTGGTSTAAVEVSYTVSGTATAGTDYTAPSEPLTLDAGASSGTITIPTLTDDCAGRRRDAGGDPDRGEHHEGDGDGQHDGGGDDDRGHGHGDGIGGRRNGGGGR